MGEPRHMFVSKVYGVNAQAAPATCAASGILPHCGSTVRNRCCVTVKNTNDKRDTRVCQLRV